MKDLVQPSAGATGLATGLGRADGGRVFVVTLQLLSNCLRQVSAGQTVYLRSVNQHIDSAIIISVTNIVVCISNEP